MRIEDRFTVALPLAQAWEVLRDVERVAPCMPGAQLTEIEGDEYRGVVKVKLGAITAQYKGSVHFAEVDEVARRMVLSAKGRETRGQGNASADVVVTLVETDAGTEIAIDTDLTISGKIAQFGRGVLADVSSKLLGEFSRCLEDLVSGDGGAGSGGDATAAIVAEDDLLADDEADDEGADPGMDLGPADPGTADPGTDDLGTTDAASVSNGFETIAGETTGFETTGFETPAAEMPAGETTGFDTPASATAAAATTRQQVAGGDGTGPMRAATSRPRLRAVTSPPSEPLDLLALAGPGLTQRALPVALVADLAMLAVVRRPLARWLLSAAGLGLVAAVVGSQRDQ